MQTVNFEVLKSAAESAGLGDSAIRMGYSGRGMFGRKCFGIVGGPPDLVAFFEELSEASLENGDDGRYGALTLDLVQAMREGIATDDMARELIYYWPNIGNFQ